MSILSAAGLVGFLSEPDHALQVFALEKINEQVESIWTEVSGAVGQIEALYEDESFPARDLAALVAAKVYFQLQEYNESMTFALGAGKLFDIEHAGEFEQTIVAKCIDTYISIKAAQKLAEAGDMSQPSEAFPHNTTAVYSQALMSPTSPFSQSVLPSKSLLSRENTVSSETDAKGTNNTPGQPYLSQDTQKSLHEIIRRIFESCYAAGTYRQVVGIAVEARNKDILREAIVRCTNDEKAQGKKAGSISPSATEDLMEYILDICMNVIQERGLRNEILDLILELLHELPNPDLFAITRCVIYLNQHAMASRLLQQIVEREDIHLLAVLYQLSFDLYDNGTQEFLQKVLDGLPVVESQEEDVKENNQAQSTSQSNGRPAEEEEPNESTQLLTELQESSGAPKTTIVTGLKKPSPLTDFQQKAYTAIKGILEGTTSIDLNLEFLYRSSHTDKTVLNKIRDSLEARNSIFHTAVTFANAFMNSGTTIDTFFRENLEWLGKAVNWSKFTATAALGVIHRGNLGQGQKLLEPYLPKEGNPSRSAYSQGGSLFALGLIYTNHGTHVLNYLREQFKRTNEEVVQHGGALGLGVAGMATGDEGIYEDLKTVLYSDSAINGEAVGIAMGLVMLGTANYSVLETMAQYAHDTQHEKIVRGLAMGMALIVYSQQEVADELIAGMIEDPDPIIRYGGIYAIAMAYCGSSSNKAVRKLLHVAVSDVSDDVRRAAVMSLGFVLFRKPGSVPRMVELLAESYNPHVRYGATMALGIACAGTGLEEAVDLLEPMMKDSVDFVRQGALISLAMILVQQNEAMNPKVADIRKALGKIIGDRHEDAMCKFGCALALGIIDAGGRNCTIALQTQTGQLNMSAIVAIIGVDHDLEIPLFKFHSNTKPSMFDYPPEQEIKTEEVPEKVKTAILSTTAQAKRRKQAKERQQRRESMDVDTSPTTPKVDPVADGETMDTDEGVIDTAKVMDEKEKAESTESDKIRKKVEKEKVGYSLENMSRVLPPQIKYISFPADGRYQPVKKPTGGVILLMDTDPTETKTLIEIKSKKKPTIAAPPGPAQASGNAPQTPGQPGRTDGNNTRGIDQAAEILNAVDEGEGEAECPDEFEVESEDGQN